MTATKLSIRLVRISFTPYLALPYATSATQNTPPNMPARSVIGMPIGAGMMSPIQTPNPVAAMAPKMSWPSAPMFQSRTRKANATARPVRMSGVALVSVSAKPNHDPKAVLTISKYTSTGLKDRNARNTATTTSARPTEAKGSTILSHSGAASRGSTTTGHRRERALLTRCSPSSPSRPCPDPGPRSPSRMRQFPRTGPSRCRPGRAPRPDLPK